MTDSDPLVVDRPNSRMIGLRSRVLTEAAVLEIARIMRDNKGPKIIFWKLPFVDDPNPEPNRL